MVGAQSLPASIYATPGMNAHDPIDRLPPDDQYAGLVRARRANTADDTSIRVPRFVMAHAINGKRRGSPAKTRSRSWSSSWRRS